MVIQEKISEDYQGQSVRFFQLENDEGLKAILMSYGATLVSLCVPDRQGKIGDVVLGFDSLSGYLGPNPYMGATIDDMPIELPGGVLFLRGANINWLKMTARTTSTVE